MRLKNEKLHKNTNNNSTNTIKAQYTNYGGSFDSNSLTYRFYFKLPEDDM